MATVIAPLTVRKRTQFLVLRHRFQRPGAPGNLLGDAAVGRELGDQRSNRGSFSVNPLTERPVNHRHDVARVGENCIRVESILNLARRRQVEIVDEQGVRRSRVDCLLIALGKWPDGDDVFAAAAPRVFRGQKDLVAPLFLDELLQQQAQGRVRPPVVDN